jgi:hypothetical protein
MGIWIASVKGNHDLNETFDAEATLKAVSEEKAAIYGVPTMFFAELDH